MELYFWTFVVAIIIFGLGAGVSVYEGVQKIIHPHPITNPAISYVVWTLLTKVETSCDRILIAGGANVEAEWEQGPAV